MEQQQQGFSAWGVVDLFGHTRIAGRIGEQVIGGETFLRVDIPNADDSFHTRLFGKGAIYSISLTDETIAREVAKRCAPEPVSPYELRHLFKTPALPRTSDPIEDGYDDLHG